MTSRCLSPSSSTMLSSPSAFSPGCRDLLCGEDASELFNFCDDSSEPIPGFAEGEADDDSTRLCANSLEPDARRDAVAWILKVRAYYRFRPLTAYLAVIYVDRFLSSRRLPKNGWAVQLLSVACLSLAAKMEETLVPSLLDLQVEGASYVFEPRTVLRMELLVLSALGWRLRTVTPFNFLSFFAHKIDSFSKQARLLVSRATQIILAAFHEITLSSYCPSTVGAVAIICAVDGTPNRAMVRPSIAASWCIGLTEEKILSCYRMMRRVIGDRLPRKSPMILSQRRVISLVKSEISPCSSPPHSKRRKPNNQSGN